MPQRDVSGNYELTAIPLDVVSSTAGINSFELSIVTNLQFSVLNGASYRYQDLLEVLRNHPCADGGQLTADIVDVNGVAVASAELTRLSESFSRSLRSYLITENEDIHAKNKTNIKPLNRDGAYDQLAADDFVDSIDLFQSAVARNWLGIARGLEKSRELKQLRIQKGFREKKDQFIPHYRLRRTLEQVLRQNDLDILNAEKSPQEFNSSSKLNDRYRHAYLELASRVEKNLSRYRDLITGIPPVDKENRISGATAPTLTEEELVKRIGERDPNTMLASAFKEPFLAQQLGMVTRWRADLISGNTLTPETNYFFCLKPIAIGEQPSKFVSIVVAGATAFSIRSGMVSPRSMVDGRNTGALVWLNNNGEHRFKTSQCNIDSAIVNTYIQQRDNQDPEGSSASRRSGRREEPDKPTNDETPINEVPPERQDQSGVDTEPPIRSSAVGIAQLDGFGVSFHAPVEDLLPAPPASPRTFCNGAPALYLEHLQQGYCIDVASEQSTSPGRKTKSVPQFHSLHLVNVTFRLVEDAQSKGIFAKGVSEDYIDLEQLTRDAYRDSKNKKVEEATDRYQDTTFAHWSGHGSAQIPPVHGLSNPVESLIKSIKVKGLQRTATTVGNSQLRLLYRNEYKYAIRTVFQGGIRLSTLQAEKALDVMSERDREEFVQSFKFVRAHSYRPGDVIDPTAESADDSDKAQEGAELTINLTHRGQRKDIILAPAPVDIDKARFHGILGIDEGEAQKYREYFIAPNLRKLYRKYGGLKKYFLDPDVNRVRIRVVSRSRNSEEAGTTLVVNNNICNVTPHQLIAEGTLSYGDPGKWRRYRPITLTFKARSSDVPKVWFGQRRAVIKIPPGDLFDVFITPELTESQVKNTFVAESFRSAESQFHPIKSFVESLNVESKPTDISILYGSPGFKDSSQGREQLIDTLVSEQLHISVIHATPAPLVAPKIRELEVRRQPNKSAAGYLHGFVSIDARTTASVTCNLTWRTLEDNPNQPEPVSVPGEDAITPRSVRFEELLDPLPDNIVTNVPFDPGRSVQCSEEILTFGGFKESESTVETRPVDALVPTVLSDLNTAIGLPGKLDKLPPIHLKLTATARAKGRYRGLYPSLEEREFESRSTPVQIDLLNMLTPPAPQISHILPTIRRTMSTDSESRTAVRDHFGFRIYIDRPWCLTGEDDRLAIACSAGDGQSLAGFVSLWGEDVFERPRLAASKRRPRASDFGVPEQSSQQNGTVSYFDDVPFLVPQKPKVTDGQSSDMPVEVKLDLASYDVRFDREQQLWYADVTLRPNFFGWLGLALYRHQPKSIEGKFLSKEPTFVHVAKLQDELVTHHHKDGFLRVTVGPVFDKTISYCITPIVELERGVIRFEEQQRKLDRVKTDQGSLFRTNVKTLTSNRWAIIKKRATAAQTVVVVI